ncbi:adenylate/guanylate cyclase domain-containing protein [Cupriavidus sp. WKF15]|uniref:adenylate/guanylate cyclase domain-containing protein n=1 Tax=Cupriavidus sp. WKF15 TaxID=3032282 RepID=UPI0023E26769|nr:adenylate/guanylate cyclase domain-containing protein [Cupriavidus sp. WKF15]WER50632.1 adenylate/guanylate cyclase domain-containing protein [Cupriavidus sp. WKF15]
MSAPRLKRLFRRWAAVSGKTGSLRVRMLLLVLLAILPMLLLILTTNLEERRAAEQRVQDGTIRLLRLTISQHERLIEGSRQLLIALAQIPVVHDRSEAACSTLFGNFLKQYPFYANLAAADLEGNVYCSGLRLAEPVNVADRGYFQRALQYKGLAIGDYQISRTSRKASVNFGYPILDETGSPKGVVFAALDLRWLDQLAVEARLPPDAVLILLDRHGTVLFEHPDWRRWMGVAAKGNALVETILSHQEEGTVELPNLEGVTSLFAFAPLRSTRGVVITTQGYLAVGIPTSVAFAQVNRAFAYRLLFFSAVALLALATAWWFGAVFILRPARALLAATERLEKGDLQARAGLLPGHGELSQLACSFDRMAERLQEHQAQLRHALTETTELKDLLDNVFASIVSGVITTDLQGKIMLCNLAALHILGYRDAEELVGRNIVELQPPLGTTLLSHVLSTARTDKAVVGLELAPTVTGRGTVYLRFNLSTLKGLQQPQGIAIVLDDVTEKRLMEAQQQLLKCMVSPAILAQIDTEHLQPAGKRTEITTLFADIHGFTSISEQLNPDDLFGLLNRYLGVMTDAVLAQEGTIDKFLGDAVMAWFNAPFPQPDHVMRALRAALGIRVAIQALYQQISPLFHLSVGIGLHVGEAVLGLVGGEQRMEYTAIGDDVNIAKRIQEHAGIDQILISAAVYARVQNQVIVRPVTVIQVKGRQKPLEVYELLGLK